MSLTKYIKDKDQLLLDGFRYRRDRLVWRCIKNKCKGRARYNGTMYTIYQDHICQAPDQGCQMERYSQLHLLVSLVVLHRL
jgi:hypothetical protein